ncbi:site-specific integrase, partial [Carboxylicivirga sp. A043]
METFSFRQFKTKFGIAGGDLTNILFYFERRIKEFGDNDQWCSWAQFTTAMRTLKKYFGSNQIDFRELTVNELEKYEQWMVTQNLSMSSINTYMASTRTIFKIAQREGAISKDYYPFGEGGYKLPSSQNVKRALKMNEIEKIYNYECKEFSYRDEAKDLWLFSYLLNGANMNDIIRLKYKNVDDEFIT